MIVYVLIEDQGIFTSSIPRITAIDSSDSPLLCSTKLLIVPHSEAPSAPLTDRQGLSTDASRDNLRRR